MQYLVVAPPVITPSEPASGAFLLASGLKARGMEAGFLDLSSRFFHYVFSRIPNGRGYPDTGSALEYLQENSSYSPHLHRTACGILNSAMKHFSSGFPGWRLTLMDAVPPDAAHRPGAVMDICRQGNTPFRAFWEDELLPVLIQQKPERVLVSVAYLSQLAAGIDLVHFLRSKGIKCVVGGSLLNSLQRTGRGLDLIRETIPEATVSDGSEFPGFSLSSGSILDRLEWPHIVGDWDYISGRPVIPYALSTGCYWNRCLFCPDAGRSLEVFGRSVLEGFLESIPSSIMDRRPVLHLIDSAVPREPLEQILPILEDRSVDFYTFARPEKWLPGMAPELAEKGCLMIQMGVESGSRALLDRYCKGVDPETSLNAVCRCAEAGIRTYVYILTGLPGESEEDIRLTSELLERAGDSVDFINFSIFNLPENCELSRRASEFSLEILDPDVPDDAILLYRPFLTEGRNPRVGARRNISDVLSVIPSVSRALARTPRWFRTSHFPMIEIDGRRTP